MGYQLQFSKQELRKCIKEYPAKELKKGLEQLYKKVEKHLCEEENLLQVSVKGAMSPLKSPKLKTYLYQWKPKNNYSVLFAIILLVL